LNARIADTFTERPVRTMVQLAAANETQAIDDDFDGVDRCVS